MKTGKTSRNTHYVCWAGTRVSHSPLCNAAVQRLPRLYNYNTAFFVRYIIFHYGAPFRSSWKLACTFLGVLYTTYNFCEAAGIFLVGEKLLWNLHVAVYFSYKCPVLDENTSGNSEKVLQGTRVCQPSISVNRIPFQSTIRAAEFWQWEKPRKHVLAPSARTGRGRKLKFWLWGYLGCVIMWPQYGPDRRQRHLDHA